MGIDVRGGLVALGKLFSNSEEYLLRGRTDAEYVNDLYQTFLNRAPDGPGAAFWESILVTGDGRNVLINYFAFSDEFALFLDGFGTGPGNRSENGLVNDLYRGILNRLPDDAGFNLYLELMRGAQCNGTQTFRISCTNVSERLALLTHVTCPLACDTFVAVSFRGHTQKHIRNYL